MSRYRVRVVGSHEDRWLRDVRELYLEDCGPARYARRAAVIAALPTVTWRGHTLYTIRCNGDFGKGPHLMNVPESLLWSLISLERFLCPFHR